MKYGITDIGSNTIRFNIYGSKNGNGRQHVFVNLIGCYFLSAKCALIQNKTVTLQQSFIKDKTMYDQIRADILYIMLYVVVTTIAMLGASWQSSCCSSCFRTAGGRCGLPS